MFVLSIDQRPVRVSKNLDTLIFGARDIVTAAYNMKEKDAVHLNSSWEHGGGHSLWTTAQIYGEDCDGNNVATDEDGITIAITKITEI